MAETPQSETDQSGGNPQPGQTITPGMAAPTPSPEAQPALHATEPGPQIPATTVVNDEPLPPMPSPNTQQPAGQGLVQWTASEFVAHEKTSGWYLTLTAGAILLSVIVYVLTREIITTLVVPAGAAALGVLAGKQPRQLAYSLDAQGFTAGDKHHSYQEFRSFSVVPEGAFSSIVFMPLKRFATLTTIYYAPEQEDEILDIIAQVLPFEERKPDLVDNFARRIRF